MIDREQITEDDVEHLRRKIIMMARQWEPVMGVHCRKWSVRYMKTRWGSCSVHKKTIRMSSMLINKPDKCIEYVVVHELTHLIEPSHNQVFHQYMTQFLPDWKERKALLNQTEQMTQDEE